MIFHSLYRLEHRGLLKIRSLRRAAVVPPGELRRQRLQAAMVGNSKRFTRQDSVEEAWRVMQPLLDASPQVHGYQKGWWGPAAADELVAGHGGWRGPWLAT
jgi:Glucose-6-phosphate dehydrogenase, C-terminal domain